MRLKLVYFAWVREKIGKGEEILQLPADVSTIDELLKHLSKTDLSYQQAFADPAKLRFALDQNFVESRSPLGEAEELAIFPPVTGG